MENRLAVKGLRTFLFMPVRCYSALQPGCVLPFPLCDQITYAKNEKWFYQEGFLQGTNMYSLVKVLFMIRTPLKTVWRDLIGLGVYPFSSNMCFQGTRTIKSTNELALSNLCCYRININ